MDPAGQLEQAVDAASSLNVPAVQCEQTTGVSAAYIVEKVPCGQLSHEVDPAGQTKILS
jgi:hypothetical protein